MFALSALLPEEVFIFGWLPLPVELLFIDSVECVVAADAADFLFCDDDLVLQLFKLDELLYTTS